MAKIKKKDLSRLRTVIFGSRQSVETIRSIFSVISLPGYSASRHSRCSVQSFHDCPCGETRRQGSLTQLDCI